MRTTSPFPGGWVATADPQELAQGPGDLAATLAGWSAHAAGPLTVRCDDTWTVSTGRWGDVEVLVLGIAMDVGRPELDQDEVVQRLARGLAASWEFFLDSLDRLSGAHVVFASSGGRVRVLQDATGMESVHYDVSGRTQLLGSHPALLAELGGYEPAEWAQAWLAHPKVAAGGVYFPGLRTLFDEIRALMPNTLLDAQARTVERFFPRQPLGTLEVGEIVDRVAPLLTGQCRWLSQHHECHVSLSGGLDTRLTLAASRDVAPRLRYHTYVLGDGPEEVSPIHANDVEMATRLAAQTGIEHEVWPLYRRDGVDPAFLEAWARTHRGAQWSGVFQGLLAERWPAGLLHLRSNILETARGYHLKNRANHRDAFDAAKLSRLFRHSVVGEFDPYFDEYIAVTGFTQESKLDFHWTDLFWWEHRMGAWHGGLVRAMKALHNTHVLYNCRRILTLMMARPLEDRASGIVVYRLIDRLWPELLDVPVFSGSRFVTTPSLSP